MQVANCVQIGLPMLILLVITQQVYILSETISQEFLFFSNTNMTVFSGVAVFEAPSSCCSSST